MATAAADTLCDNSGCAKAGRGDIARVVHFDVAAGSTISSATADGQIDRFRIFVDASSNAEVGVAAAAADRLGQYAKGPIAYGPDFAFLVHRELSWLAR